MPRVLQQGSVYIFTVVLGFTAFRFDFRSVVLQVNPHTHQLKICDFGSAKVLVRFIYSSF